MCLLKKKKKVTFKLKKTPQKTWKCNSFNVVAHYCTYIYHCSQGLPFPTQAFGDVEESPERWRTFIWPEGSPLFACAALHLRGEPASLRFVQIKGGWCFLHAPPTTAPDQREGSFSTAKRSVLLPPITVMWRCGDVTSGGRSELQRECGGNSEATFHLRMLMELCLL